MRPLSATECITPAIDRTKLILFAPFRKGRTWKLSATAYLCRIGTMFFPFPLIYLAFLPAVRSVGTVAVIGLCTAVLIGTAIFVYIFHLCSRLQFAYLDILINRGEFVAPAWRKYGPQSRRWTGLKFLLGTAITLLCAVPIAAYIRHLVPVFETMKTLTPGQPPPPELMGAVFAGYGIILLVFGPTFILSSLLADFIVPSLALENTSLREAFRRMFALIGQEPGQFAIYTLIKIGLAITGVMGATIAWEILFIFATLIVGLVVVLLGLLLHLIGIPTVVLMVLGALVALVWYACSAIYALFLFTGPVYTFLDAYALYFLGGRYPMLGDLLDRSTPPPAYPYVAGFPPPYQPPPAPPLTP